MFRSFGVRPYLMPAPVLLVGTYAQDGTPNIMTAAWGGIVASQPPCISVSLQRVRASYENILARNAFTVNIPSADMVAQADFCGLVSGRKINKFEALGYTPTPAEHIDAPLIAECPAVLELKLTQTVEIGSHVQFIGEIMDVKIQESCLDAAGQPVASAVNPLIFDPINREYLALGDIVAKAFSVGRSISPTKASTIGGFSS